MAAESDSLKSLTRDVATYLRFLRDLGLDYYVPSRTAVVSVANPALASPSPAPAAHRSGSADASGAPTASASAHPLRSTQSSRPYAPPPGPAPRSLTDAPLPPPLSPAARAVAIKQLYAEIAKCAACRLHETRTNPVPGDGSPMADLFFIGEAPGADEDRQGVPFVGRAGQKLNEMIAYLGLRREEVYIGNILKSRPPGNRTPAPDEAEACRPFLERQLDIVQPKVICLLGGVALKHLTGNMAASITRARGHWLEYRGIPVMPTFHPAFLLRQYTLENRRNVAADFDAIRAKLRELGCKVGDKPARKS